MHWLLLHGQNEYAGLRERLKRVTPGLLEQPAEGQPATMPYISRFMRGIWASRLDLQAAFDLSQPAQQQAFIRWYFLFGVTEHGLLDCITQRQLTWLLSSVSQQRHLPQVLKLVWDQEPLLQKQFPDPESTLFIDWVRQNAQQRYPILSDLMALGERHESDRYPRQAVVGDKPMGINLIGYAKGQFGIGEDVRMAALACQVAGIPFTIYNVEPGKEVEQNDSSADAFLSDKLPYAINLFCTTGIETARLAAVQGDQLFEGHYCIGYWPWELPEWPQAWHHAYQLVDEVWASSRYAYQAFVASSPKPVRHMPMAVTVEATAGRSRQDFGLPEGHFLFVFSFDFLSSLERKNPQACVEAFRQAFPRGDEPVGLVVKAMRAAPDNPLWQALMAQTKTDGRIHVINETLSRGGVLDLYRACDCFVSLHRSEGFGRGIAEAMLQGKPVITTGYSGNMDFTTPGTAALVDHTLVALSEGDYPFGEGQHWAEPSVTHAAWWMQRLATQPKVVQRLADAGRQLATATYAPSRVGEQYRAVLATQEQERNSLAQCHEGATP